MTLGQTRTIVTEDHRHMSILWRLLAQRLQDVDLPRCIIEMIVAPNNGCNLHIQIIYNDRQVIGR